MSLVIQPKADLSQAVTTTTMAAVAVTEAIEETTNISPQIKWVNDVYLDGKKICARRSREYANRKRKLFQKNFWRSKMRPIAKCNRAL